MRRAGAKCITPLLSIFIFIVRDGKNTFLFYFPEHGLNLCDKKKTGFGYCDNIAENLLFVKKL